MYLPDISHIEISWILPALGIGLWGASKVYDLFRDNRDRGDYLQQQDTVNDLSQRQQDFAEHTTLNAAQIRRKDLESAGLHPTLAAGGAAHTSQAHLPSVGSHKSQPSNVDVMQQALMYQQLKGAQANISLTRAEAARTRAETRRTRIDTGLMLPRYQLSKNEAWTRETDMGIRASAEERMMRLEPLEMELRRANIRGLKLDNMMSEIEHLYMRQQKSKMPVRDSQWHELENSMRRAGVPAHDIFPVLQQLRRILY